MSWDASAPPFPVALRADLAACALWVSEVNSAGQEAAHIHYPWANVIGSQGGATDLLPIALITQVSDGLACYAEGAGGITDDLVMELDIYIAATTVGGTPRSLGYVESFGKTIALQLLSRQPRIIPYKGRISFDQASDPTPGALAADDAGVPVACAYHHLRLRLPCGYNAG